MVAGPVTAPPPPAPPSNVSPDPMASPVLTFFGPDNISQVKAIDGSGFEVARFSIESPERRSFNISRLVAPGSPPNPICSAHKSSLSGKTKMSVHGHEIELYEGLEGRQVTMPGLGKTLWKTDGLSEKRFKVKDGNKQIIARVNIKELRMDVFIPGDEIVLDCLLASYIALVKAKNADAAAAEGISAGAELIGALAGGGGGGGGG